jgi:ATP-dependent Clp protease ATP-binding subunit ClpX
MADEQDNQKLSSERVVMAMLRLGKCLLNLSFLSDLGPSRLIKPLDVTRLKGEINELEECVESAICDPKHRLLRSAIGIKRNEFPNSLVVRILACVAWQTLNGDPASISISRLAGAVSMDDPGLHIEARRLIRTMVFKADTICQRDSEGYGGELIAGVKLLKSLSGENQLPVVWTSESLKEAKDEWERLKNVEVFKRVSNRNFQPTPEQKAVVVSPIIGEHDTPKAIFNALIKSVIGMDAVVRRYALQMAIHLKRIAILKSGVRPSIPQVCVLLTGPSGSGKTFLVEQCGNLLKLPFCVGNMAEVSSEAFVGPSVSDLFLPFFRKGVSIADVQNGGVLFCDEMDKRRLNTTEGHDAVGQGPQGEILRILESSGSSKLMLGNRRSNDTLKGFIDPFGMAFVLGGAFSGIEEVIKARRHSKSGMGFACNHTDDHTQPDIREFLLDWFMPELLNRIGSVIVIPTPTHDQLVKIATRPTGIIERQNEFLSSFGIQICPSAEAVNEIADFCLSNKTFARGIRNLLSGIVEEAIFTERSGEIPIGVEDVRRVIGGLRREPEGLL